jgi:hypothetical protein
LTVSISDTLTHSLALSLFFHLTEGCNFSTIWSLEAESGRDPSEDKLDLNHVTANDVYATLEAYGVEAARSAIGREVSGVFDVYGIDVDPRHLSLIADVMTFGGGYRPFNRNGIFEASSSPFLQVRACVFCCVHPYVFFVVCYCCFMCASEAYQLDLTLPGPHPINPLSTSTLLSTLMIDLQMSFETTATFLTAAAVEGDPDKLASPSARIVMGQLARQGTGAFDLRADFMAMIKHQSAGQLS